jgi:hypothetical protein
VVAHACWDRRAAAAQLAAGAGADHIRRHRAHVHGGWLIGLENGALRGSSGTKSPDTDVSLDDPSVGALLIEACPLFARRAAAAKRVVKKLGPSWDQPLIDPPKTVANLLLGARVPDNDLPKIGIGDLKIAEGEVWEITVRALIIQEEKRKVLSEAVHALLAPFVLDGKTWWAGPPERIYVESPTEAMPIFEEVRAALQTAVGGRSVAVSVEPATLVDAGYLVENDWAWRARKFAYLSAAELARQMWRWTGRPLDPYPFASKGGYTEPVKLALLSDPDAYRKSEISRIGAALRWEVKAFGDRDASDYVSTRHVLRPIGRTDLRRERVEGDGRAQHWRFRLTVASRYAPIISDPKGREITGPDPKAPLKDPWQRAFVPVSPPDILRPPALRVMLPLTASTDGDGRFRPPPLLAVLDDAWFDVGGAAEELVADIEEVSARITKDESIRLQEFGPDPIRTGRAWGSASDSKDPFEPGPFVVAHPVGPIGYTYDEGASAPRFAHSSFMVDVAPALGVAEPIPDWSFVKLSLRRLLVPEAVEGYEAPTNTADENMPVSLASGSGGAPAFIDIDAEPGGHDLTLALQLRLGGSDQTLPAPSPFTATSRFRVTLERLAVGEVDAGKRPETWRFEIRPRNEDTAKDHHPLRWVETVVVPEGAAAELRLTWSKSGSGTTPSVKVSPEMRPYHVSRPSPPKWTQLAADASRFAVVDASDFRKDAVTTDDLLIVRDGNQWTVTRRVDGTTIRLEPYDRPVLDSKLSTELWAVATERVRDAGRREVERYLALFRIPDDNHALRLLHKAAEPVSGGEIVFRILEIERRKEDAGVADGWPLLWPPVPPNEPDDSPPKDDASARVVKVSRPISAHVKES